MVAPWGPNHSVLRARADATICHIAKRQNGTKEIDAVASRNGDLRIVRSVSDLLAFLQNLTDDAFLTDPALASPW